MANDAYWVWMSLVGLFLMTVVWKIAAAICAASFRLPLSDGEITKTCYACLLTAVLFQLMWWGNNGTWWMSMLTVVLCLYMWAWTGAVFTGQRQSAQAQIQRFIDQAGPNQ